MKILLACEGNSEVYLLKSLIQNGYLLFNYPLILDEPIKVRQLDDIASVINSLDINEEIIVCRIGDTLKEEMSLAKFKLRANHIKIYKFCTKPEIEILVIINEQLISEYKKSKKRPKTFVNEKIKRFDPELYFLHHDMINAIKEYKRLKKHKNDEMYLIDLFDENNFIK